MGVLRFVRSEVLPEAAAGERATASVTMLVGIIDVLLQLQSTRWLGGVSLAEVYGVLAPCALGDMARQAEAEGGSLPAAPLPLAEAWELLLQKLAAALVVRGAAELSLEEAEGVFGTSEPEAWASLTAALQNASPSLLAT